MRAMRAVAALLHAIIVVAMPIVLFLSPLYLLVTPTYVRHEYGLAHVPAPDRFGPVERLRLSDATIAYLRGHIDREALATLRTDAGEIAYLPREVQHLADVKGVMDAMYLAHGLAVALGAVAAFVLWRSGALGRIAAGIATGVWVAGGLIALVIVSALLDFGRFFTLFHGLFFASGSWLFEYEDTLIQLYPLEFWMDAVWKMGALIALGALAALGVSRWVERRHASHATSARTPALH